MKWPRVWGGAGVAPFVPARNTAGRPIPDRRPGSRLASWAGKWPTRAEEGDARQAVSAARLMAVGLRAQEEAAETGRGLISCMGLLDGDSLLLLFFSIFQKHFL